MWLQAVYFALSIYGWYEWLHGGARRTALTVTRTPLAIVGDSRRHRHGVLGRATAR